LIFLAADAEFKSGIARRRSFGIFDGQGKSVSKKTIVAALGEDSLSYDLRRLDTQINRLRRKVVDATGADLPLKTLRNEGYQFCGAVAPR